MSALLITRGESSTLPSTKKDGKIYITTDTHKIYIDNGTTRFEIDAKYADALKNTLKLVLGGDAAGEISFDGSESKVTLNVSIEKLTELSNELQNKLSLSGGTMTGNIIMSNSNTHQKNQPYMSWKTFGGNTPYQGFATDQTDGTFMVGSIEGTNYQAGLAIGGGSHNLLWKGKKVLVDGDVTNYSLPLASSTTRGGVKIGFASSGKNYAVQLDNEKMYVNVPWENTEYGIATKDTLGLIKSGGDITVDNSGVVSVLDDSHQHTRIAWIDDRNQDKSPDDISSGLTLQFKTNGADGISDGGQYHSVISAKGWGDYSGGPWWQATVSVNNNMFFRKSTSGSAWGNWQTVLSNNNYANYAVTLTTAQTISGTKTMTGGLSVSGRVANSGDDEGIVISKADNGYAGLCLGDPAGVRSVFYLLPDNGAEWRYYNTSGPHKITHPAKSGVIALTSDLDLLAKKDGTNATGTWPISISGNAATASLAAKLNANNAKSDKATRFSGGLPIECDNLLDHSIKGSAPRWCTTSTNPCTSSTDSNLSTFNVADSRLYWVTATGTLINQPSQYGYILDIGNGAERHQIWMTQPAGDLWHRGGNGSGWGCNWKIIFDNTNYYNYALPLSGGTLTGGLTFSGSNGIITRHIDGENSTFAGDLYLNYGRSAPIHVGSGGSYTISADGSYYNGASAATYNLYNTRNVSGDSHAAALQNEFNSYKGSVGRNRLSTYYSSAYSNGSFYMGYFLSGYDSNPYGGFYVCHYNTPYYVGITNGAFTQYQLWKAGDAIWGAVWNDYAECRESQDDEPGYVLIENGDDTLSKSTERLQQFAGISSDTWGFSQGKTEKAKTHIAVAGRVLAYPYQDRNKYKPGDAVCTAPGGTVDIMTEEEIVKYPHRIVGIVSCVPDYEEWGGGENADRDPVKVNGRVWIKVK